MYVYFQSVFRIQNFQHSESVHLFSMCIFSQISYSESAHALNYSENWPKIHIYSKMDDFWIRNILLIEYICVFLVNSQNNSMHARFQNMRSDWKYTYWKDGHFLNAEILNSENWLKIHIHSKSTWSFGPLSSFGPVMVIRTPIRKDPRADSQIISLWEIQIWSARLEGTDFLADCTSSKHVAKKKLQLSCSEHQFNSKSK